MNLTKLLFQSLFGRFGITGTLAIIAGTVLTSLAWYDVKGEVFEWCFDDVPRTWFAAVDLHHIPLLLVYIWA